ncbi:MAG: T9SS type A sorting domain-containing protein [Bacteroidota bacterium]|jgi:photosystem II stability/assembly factor-like uncharacterized protein
MKKYYCFFIAFIFTTAFLHHTASAQWIQTNGPYGGLVMSFASDGTNIFAGTNSGGVYLSTNNGQSWSAANSGLPIGELASITINGSMIFGASYNNGVYLSTNNGTSWSAVNSGLANRNVLCVAAKDSLILAGTDNGIFLSHNNGSNWIPTGSLLPSTNAVGKLGFGGGKIFAGMEGSGDGYCSADTGKSWTKLNLESHGIITCIVIHEPYVYIGTSEGIFVSTDTGATWTHKTSINVYSLAVKDSVIIGTSGMSIFKSTDYGYSWVENNTTTPVGGGLYSAVSNGSSFFVGTQNSIFRSTDNGESWTLANTGLCAMKITCCASSNNILFTGGWGGGIYTSSDNGESWTHDYLSLEWAANISALTVSPTIDGISNSNIYAASLGNGVFMSSDNGQNWSEMDNGLNKYVYALSARPTTDSFILFAGTSFGMFMSVDSGKSWTADGLKDTIVLSLAANDSCLFAGTSQVSFAGTSPAYSNPGGVFSSTNSGASWNPSGLSHHEIYSLTFTNGNLIAETPEEGFFVSTDGGQSWAPLNAISQNIQNAKINCIAAVNNNIFAGTEGKSVWRCPISDMITGVKVNGKTFPTQYSLQQNYPNPFNPTTTIEFELPKNAMVVLKVYDLLGREVRTLVDEKVEAGFHTTKFDASRLASGVYFTRMFVQPQDGSNPFVQVRKMLMLK